MKKIDIEISDEQIYEVLIDDVNKIWGDLEVNDKPHLRRNAIRAISSGIEGLVSHAKNTVLINANSMPDLYSEFEISALREETYSINDNGAIQIKSIYIPLKTSVKLIIKTLDKNQSIKHTATLKHPGWDALLRNVECRNRLMHPKKASDLKVSKRELDDAMRAFHWVLALNLRVGDAVKNALQIHLEIKKEKIKEVKLNN